MRLLGICACIICLALPTSAFAYLSPEQVFGSQSGGTSSSDASTASSTSTSTTASSDPLVNNPPPPPPANQYQTQLSGMSADSTVSTNSTAGSSQITGTQPVIGTLNSSPQTNAAVSIAEDTSSSVSSTGEVPAEPQKEAAATNAQKKTTSKSTATKNASSAKTTLHAGAPRRGLSHTGPESQAVMILLLASGLFTLMFADRKSRAAKNA